MLKALTASVVVLLTAASPTVFATESSNNPHNLSNFPLFKSVQEATNFFGKAEIVIKVLKLTQFEHDHLLLAAYPYSGKDTIDVYCFVKYGDYWVIKMLYFHLRPKARHLRVEESADQIMVYCGKEELVRLTPDKQLNSVER